MIQTKNLIIGFGKAGKTLAGLFDKHGQSIVLVEQSEKMYGGTCINVGCIPSKKLIHEAKTDVFDEAMQNKDALISTLREANFKKINDLSNVRVITAQASFVDDNTVTLSTGETVRAERIFINTGATPIMPNVAGVDGERIYDSTGLLNLGDTQKNRPQAIGHRGCRIHRS